jgi:hypothetical protein
MVLETLGVGGFLLLRESPPPSWLHDGGYRVENGQVEEQRPIGVAVLTWRSRHLLERGQLPRLSPDE